MNDYEILSRASAFLLNVDPVGSNHEGIGFMNNNNNNTDTSTSSTTKTHSSQGHVKKTAYPHLQTNRDLRKKLLQKQEYAYDPASGPTRLPHQLNWLEFCPANFRPKVHVVASSHVISPWLWPKYYDQDWLKIVNEEHVRYSLEVWGAASDGGGDGGELVHDGKLHGSYKPLAKFALNPYPIHHPNEMDVAVIHLKEEDAVLKHMMKLGVQPLNLPTMYELENSDDPVFQPNERFLFQGYEVYEDDKVEKTELGNDDARMFHPYSSLGHLTQAYPDRFLAETNGGPLPEGLCGGAVIQLPSTTAIDIKRNKSNLMLRGVVEGIVPTNHENTQLAGLASFIPAYRIREFIDFSERIMLEQIIDEDVFKRVVEMKNKQWSPRGSVYGGGNETPAKDADVHQLNMDEGSAAAHDDEDEDDDLLTDPSVLAGIEGTSEDPDTPHIDREYQEIVASLRKNHTPEEVDAILATVERERQEVIDILESEGGDMDDVIEAVRRRTYEEKERIMNELQLQKDDSMSLGEIVSKDGEKS